MLASGLDSILREDTFYHATSALATAAGESVSRQVSYSVRCFFVCFTR